METWWNAVKENDRGYDGMFYYGVKTTGIFCRPSCPSRTPARKNVVYFSAAEEALEMGFRPCKRCRPDLIGIFDPDGELAVQAEGVLEAEYGQPDILRLLPVKLGVSPQQFARVAAKVWGCSPKEWLQKLRIRKAMADVAEGKENILEIACKTGFASVSAFYAAFRRYSGCSPGEYRRQWKEKEGELL